MLYVDEMQNVNNSFTNLASQLKSYKQGKLEYAKTMQEGLYSKGNSGRRSKEAAIIYGFYDADGDNRSDARYDAPFQIQDGGNIAFNVGGQEITYNGMEEPFLKDTKFLNSLNATSETAYNSGLRGNANNPYTQDAYKQQLNDTLQNEDALRSIIFDFDPEAPMLMQNPNDPAGPKIKIGTALDSGIIDLNGARELVNKRLLKAREDAYIAGKKEYDKKQIKLEEANGDGFIGFPSDSQAYFDDQILTAPPGQEFTIKAANKKYHKKSKKEYILFKRDDGIYYYDKKDQLPSQAILLEKDNNLGIII